MNETGRSKREPSLAFTWRDALWLAGLLAAQAALLVHFGRQRFEFFDMSAFLDAGYRVACGQQLYRDFYYIAGPVHPYMHAFFFTLFGFTQTAVLVHLCTVSLLVTACGYVLARLYLRPALAVLLAALTALAFNGAVCHPWYDQNAAFWLIVAVTLWECVRAFGLTRFLPAAAWGCGVLTAMSFLTKTNTGAAGGLMFLALLLASPQRWRNLALFAFGNLACLGLWALVVSPRAFVEETLLAYAPGGRLLNFARLGDAIFQTPSGAVIVLAVGLAILGGWRYCAKNLAHFVLLGGMTFTAVFTAWTGSMITRANISWTGLQCIWLFVLAHELPWNELGLASVRLRRSATLGLSAVSCWWLYGAFGQMRELTTWTWNASVVKSDYALRTPAFAGWRCDGAVGEGLDRCAAFVAARIPREQSLLVFPDCTLLYGLTGHDSYRGAPFIFQRGQILTGALYDNFRARFLTSPPDWIVLHQFDLRWDLSAGPILEWLRLDDYLRKEYRVVWTFGGFSVLRREVE